MTAVEHQAVTPVHLGANPTKAYSEEDEVNNELGWLINGETSKNNTMQVNSATKLQVLVNHC